MKTLKFIILLSFISVLGFGQQNGTFKNIYVDSIRPVYPSSIGMWIGNKYNPLNININDTALWQYIDFWSKKGAVIIDTSKLVTKYEMQTGLSLDSIAMYGYSPITGYIASLELSSAKSIPVRLHKRSLTTGQDLILDTIGMYYDSHKTSSNPVWVTDRQYVDSLVINTSYILDSSKLLTLYKVANGAYIQDFNWTAHNFNLYSLDNQSWFNMFKNNFDIESNNNDGTIGSYMQLDTTGLLSLHGQTGAGVGQTIQLQGIGAKYGTHKTWSDSNWLTDRQYVDSVIINQTNYTFVTTGRNMTVGTVAADTTGCFIRLPMAGKYMINFTGTLVVTGATFANNQHCEFSVTSTTNPSTLINGAYFSSFIPAMTVETNRLGGISGSVIYNAASNELIKLNANISSDPSIGTVTASGLMLNYVKLK